MMNFLGEMERQLYHGDTASYCKIGEEYLGSYSRQKREVLGNYLYFDIWKNFIYQGFIIHQVFKLQV